MHQHPGMPKQTTTRFPRNNQGSQTTGERHKKPFLIHVQNLSRVQASSRSSYAYVYVTSPMHKRNQRQDGLLRVAVECEGNHGCFPFKTTHRLEPERPPVCDTTIKSAVASEAKYCRSGRRQRKYKQGGEKPYARLKASDLARVRPLLRNQCDAKIPS
jgi:hypothetical protein